MKHTDPMKKETYEKPLVQDIEPFTLTHVIGGGSEKQEEDDPDSTEGGW